MKDSMTPPLEEQPGSTPPSIGSAPVTIEPKQSIRLQTWVEKPTTVHVENASDKIGFITLHWGTRSFENAECYPGTTDLEREFGGVPLNIQNSGTVPLSVAVW